jgi:hypothetical protein
MCLDILFISNIKLIPIVVDMIGDAMAILDLLHYSNCSISSVSSMDVCVYVGYEEKRRKSKIIFVQQDTSRYLNYFFYSSPTLLMKALEKFPQCPFTSSLFSLLRLHRTHTQEENFHMRTYFICNKYVNGASHRKLFFHPFHALSRSPCSQQLISSRIV